MRAAHEERPLRKRAATPMETLPVRGTYAKGGGVGGADSRTFSAICQGGYDQTATRAFGICTTGARTASSLATVIVAAFFSSCCRPSFTVWQREQGCSPSKVLEIAFRIESLCAYSTSIFAQATDCSTAQCPPRICTAAISTRNLVMRGNKQRVITRGTVGRASIC